MLSLEQWVELVGALQSPDNNLRGPAEKLYEEQETDHVCEKLLELVSKNEPQIMTLCLVLLRKKINNDFKEISDNFKAQLGPAIINVYRSITTEKKKLIDVVVILLKESAEGDNPRNWPEFCTLLDELAKTNTQEAAAALYAMGEAAREIGLPAITTESPCAQLLINFEQFPELNGDRCETIFKLVSELYEDESIIMIEKLKTLIPQCLQSIKAMDKESVAFTSVLSEMDIPCYHGFFKEQVTQTLEVLIQVNSHHALSLIGHFRDEITADMMPVILDPIFRFLRPNEEDVQAWASEEKDEEDEQEEVDRAVDLLDTLGQHEYDKIQDGQSGINVMIKVFETVEKLHGTNQWTDLVCALRALVTVSNFMTENFMLNGTAKICTAAMDHEHPHVRHQAWVLLSQIATDHKEDLHELLDPESILQKYCQVESEQCMRVKVRILKSFKYFAADLDQEVATPFAVNLLRIFGSALTNELLSEHAISAIGMFCVSLDKECIPFYGELMPILKQLMNQKMSKVEDRKILAEIFEASSSLGMSVGSEMFAPDATEIMQGIVTALNASTGDEDPVKEYALMAAQRMAYTLKKNFAPFLPGILPQIYSRLKNTATDLTKNVDEAFDPEEYGDSTVNLSMIRDEETGEFKFMLIKSSQIQDLLSAVECLQVIVQNTENGFAPYLKNTAQELIPLLEFQLDDDVRLMASDMWGDLVKLARSESSELLSEMVLGFVKNTMEAWDKNIQSPNIDINKVEGQGAALASCIKNAGPSVLTTDQVKLIGERALQHMQNSFTRIPNYKNEEEDDLALVECEKNIQMCMSDTIGGLMENYKEDFKTHIAQIYGQVLQSCFQDPERIRIGFFMGADIFNYLEYDADLWNFLIPKCIAQINTKSENDLLQPAAYDLGLAALKQEFQPFTEECVKRCVDVIGKIRSTKKLKDLERQTACDNVIFCLTNMLITQKLEDRDTWTFWIESLPCRADVEEGRKVHAIFVNLVKSRHAGIQENWKEVLRIFSEIYNGEYTDEKTDEIIVELVGVAGQENLSRFASDLDNKKQKKLIRILSEASAKGC